MSEWFETYGFGRIGGGLWMGALPGDAADVAVLAATGITAVVNLCEDAEYAPGRRPEVERAFARHGIAEIRLPCTDFGTVASAAIESGARTVLELLGRGDRVYLHCRAGWQRSATVAIAAVALRDGIGPDAARGVVKRGRPSAEPLPHQLEELWRWWRARPVRP